MAVRPVEKSNRTGARAAGTLAAAIGLLALATSAWAWKPSTHVFLAEEAVKDALDDGKVTIYATSYLGDSVMRENGQLKVIGTYAVDTRVLNAIRDNRPQFRAGVLGPDAYPDILTGQQIIHPAGANSPGQPVDVDINTGGPGTDPWLTHLWNLAYGTTGSTATRTPEVRAFVAGYLSHAAGDVYAHTMINSFSGGPFHFTPKQENALKHVVLEGYLAKRTPDLASWTVSINGVDDFIYQNMINAKPNSVLQTALLKGDASSTSVPKVFSKLRIELQKDIDDYYQTKSDYQKRVDAKLKAAADCQPTDFSCSRVALTAEATKIKADQAAFVLANGLTCTYKEHWRDDIDAGLKAWPATSHEMAKALVFNQNGIDRERANEVANAYVQAHLLSMAGAPDVVGVSLQMADQIMTALGIPAIKDAIADMKHDFLNYLLTNAFGVTIEKLEEYAENPELKFNPTLNTSAMNTEGTGTLVSLQTFNSEQLHINDPGYQHPELRYDVHRMPAAHNTITLIKMLMMTPASVNQLMSDLGSTSTLSGSNVMLGYIKTLDGSNQWNANSVKMVAASDCAAYRKIFMKQPGETGCMTLQRPLTTEIRR